MRLDQFLTFQGNVMSNLLIIFIQLFLKKEFQKVPIYLIMSASNSTLTMG